MGLGNILGMKMAYLEEVTLCYKFHPILWPIKVIKEKAASNNLTINEERGSLLSRLGGKMRDPGNEVELNLVPRSSR